MRHAPTKNEASRFKGTVRHYHRSSTRPNRTWDEWIDGDAKPENRRNWLKITLVTIAVMGLLGIIAALIIELR